MCVRAAAERPRLRAVAVVSLVGFNFGSIAACICGMRGADARYGDTAVRKSLEWQVVKPDERVMESVREEGCLAEGGEGRSSACKGKNDRGD